MLHSVGSLPQDRLPHLNIEDGRGHDVTSPWPMSSPDYFNLIRCDENRASHGRRQTEELFYQLVYDFKIHSPITDTSFKHERSANTIMHTLR